MKHLLFLLLLLPLTAFAQWPAAPNKIRLGNQTTGDGLVVRTAAAPSWTPSTIKNAWLAFDTVAAVFYYYDAGTWNVFESGSTAFANNGLTMSGDTVQLGGTQTKNTEVDINGKTLRFRDAAGYPDLFLNSTYGILSSDANTYLDIGSVAGRARIVAATTAQLTSAGNTDVSATDTVTITGQRIRMNAADTRIQQVSRDNALNRLVALDSLTGRLYYIDKSSIAGGGGGSGTVTSITAGVGLTGGTITTSGTIAADTSGMLVSKSFLTNQGYTTNTGTVTGTGTTNTLAKWTSSTALGNSLFTDDGTNSVAGGTASFRLPNGTTAQRPGTPSAGMQRYNTSNGVMEWYGASVWESPLKINSAFIYGVGYSKGVWYGDADGKAVNELNTFTFDPTNKWLGIGLYPTSVLNTTSSLTGLQAGLVVKNTNTSNYAYASVQVLPNSGQLSYIFATNSTYSVGGVVPANSFGHYSNGDGGIFFWADNASGYIQQRVSSTNVTRTTTGGFGIFNTSPQRSLHVTGEARITDLTTDTPTRIVGADADGDLGAITVGTGLSLTSGTLSATGGAGTVTSVGITAPAAGITVSGSPVTSSGSMTLALADDLAAVEGLSASGIATRTASNTWAARTIVAGAGMAVTNGDGVAGNPSLSLEFSEGYLSVAGGGTTVTAATPERIDADSPGTATSSILGTEFSVSGSTIDWTGADDSMMKISGTVSFSISDNTDMKVSIYKEGVELAVTEVRVTMVAGDYHTVHLPEIHTAADDNDTFAVYVEPVSGTTTTTVHRYHISIKKLY